MHPNPTLPSLRHLVRQGRQHCCRTFVTSLVQRDASQPFTLPPARLRALISLYHQSSSFITPANLSDRIDHAFTDLSIVPQLGLTLSSRTELQERLKARRNANEVGPGKAHWKGVPLDHSPGKLWSDKRGARQSQVAATLWGTELSGKPALETVQEKAKDAEHDNQVEGTST